MINFWNLVDLINWKSNPCVYESEILVAKTLGFDPGKITNFHLWVRAREDEMYEALDEYLKKHNKSVGLGDDSFSDLCSHMVGLGKDHFEACIKDPSIAYQMGVDNNFVEKFSYCVPSTLEDFKYETYIKRAELLKGQYLSCAKYSAVTQECLRVVACLDLLIAKKGDEFMESNISGDLRKISSLVSYDQCPEMRNHFGINNLFLDFDNYRKHLI